MARKFSELLEKMPPEARARAEEGARKAIAEMPLDELREARKLTQEHLAEILNVTQPQISKLERRTDMYLSTIEKMVRAMGGELEIIAVFPEGRVKINQFHRLDR